MPYLDLTHTFKGNMPVFPGDQPPELEQTAFLESDGCNQFSLKTSMHVGTHLDAPFHMLENGKRLSEFPAEHFFGRGVLIDAVNKPIDADLLTAKQISKGDILLVMTGFSKKFGTPEYYEQYPEISETFAQKCVELGIKILGMDSPSPDRAPYNIHKILLKNDILIIENLTNLESLIDHPEFNIIALPPKFEADGAPVRVIAEI